MLQALQGALMLAAGTELPPGKLISFDKEFLITVGIQWINVVILTVVLVKVLWNPVKKFMTGRTARIQGEIDAAKQEREAAQELKEQYETMLEEIEGEREEILLTAHKKAMERSDQLLFDARREAEAMYNRSLAELENERKNMADELKKQMIEISILMAGRFVEVSIDSETQNRLIEEAFDSWEGY